MSKALSDPAGIRPNSGTRDNTCGRYLGSRTRGRRTCMVSRTNHRCCARMHIGHAPLRHGYRGGAQASSLSASADAASDVGVGLPANKATWFACQRSLNTVASRRFFASRALDDGRCQGLPLLIVHQGGPSPKSPRGSSEFGKESRLRDGSPRRRSRSFEGRVVIGIRHLLCGARANVSTSEHGAHRSQLTVVGFCSGWFRAQSACCWGSAQRHHCRASLCLRFLVSRVGE